jgi:hypothetical protein
MCEMLSHLLLVRPQTRILANRRYAGKEREKNERSQSKEGEKVTKDI